MAGSDDGAAAAATDTWRFRDIGWGKVWRRQDHANMLLTVCLIIGVGVTTFVLDPRDEEYYIYDATISYAAAHRALVGRYCRPAADDAFNYCRRRVSLLQVGPPLGHRRAGGHLFLPRGRDRRACVSAASPFTEPLTRETHPSINQQTT